MGYQALLFCPEEKTARTVTQVLSELEFAVEACTEPFVAVKKLMADHFDAIVVDCDNEQNATLLFKSARNSTPNQTSLAVAVVEGQAGVAKAFRIGANLVLTKPINVEQAKGTLRVARGLLRKGDPGKPTAASAGAQVKSSGVAPGTPKLPAPPVPPVLPRPSISSAVAGPAMSPGPKPFQAASAKAASPAPGAQTPDPFEGDVLDVDTEAPPAPGPTKSVPSQPFSKTFPGGVNPSGAVHSGGVSAGTGAASAPAPARTAQELFEQPATASASTAEATTLDLDKSHGSEPSVPAPSFTFGGADASESTGISRRAIIGVAAAALVAAGLYFVLTHFHEKSAPSSPVAQQPAPTGSVTSPATQPNKPQPTSSAPQDSSAAPVLTPSSSPVTHSNTSVEKPHTSNTAHSSEEANEEEPAPRKNSAKKANTESPTSTKSAAENKEGPPPLMVKNGTAMATSTTKAAPAADAPAPSVLEIAPAASDDGMPNNLIPDSNAPKPVLQTLNVSQGVSQGLLIKKVQPTYPPTALRMHVEGSVQLTATISKTGSITFVKVVSGEPLLAQAAMDAVKQWKYKPYFLNGDPVEIQTQITVNFKLPR